jgi:hypothetical protein
MVDIRQTPKYASYLKKIGWKVERSAEINYFIKTLPIFGSIIKLQRPENIKIKKIRDLAQKYKARQIVVEPNSKIDKDYLEKLGFKLAKSPFLPSKTLQLDLTSGKEKLTNRFKKDARAAIRKTDNMKLTRNEKISEFRKKWKNAVGLKMYVPPLSHLKALKKSFKNECLLISHENSGAIFLLGDKIAYYWQAFTDKGGRKDLSQYRIVFEGILWAKRKGAKIFDFEGIYDSRFPNKSWAGFTHFKKSFGGEEKIYEGAYTKWLLRK